MPRYISRSQAFKKAIVKAEQTLVQTARGPEQIESRRPMTAFFEQGGATADEVKLAMERFQFKGLAERENPARRISVYDTDEQSKAHGWSDDLKAEIEALLDRGQDSNYFKVEAKEAALPWPSYDQSPANSILEIAMTVGVEPSAVLAYERDHQNRPAVVRALEKTLGDEEAELEVVVAA